VSYIQPLLTVFLSITAIGASRCWLRSKEKPYRILFTGFVGLFLISWPPMAWLASQPLERYPHRAIPSGEPQAIVVLAAGVLPPVLERPITLADAETYERCQYAAWLHGNWRRLPVLACGGPGPDLGEPYSVIMRRILQRDGVPDSMIWTEELSLSTRENALYATDVLRSKGISKIALVTHSYHMLRAEKCFRTHGFTVTPAPFFETHSFRPEDLLPGWRAIDDNERALHEGVGLVWYWLRGWI